MKQILSIIVAGTLLTNILSGCAPATVTDFSESADGSLTTIVAPVLWVGFSDGGTEVSGVDSATVEVNRASQEPFEIHLEGLAASGAGPAWRASAGSAAALGILAGGLDPEITEIDFSVDSPIDGPSAGGILAVAVLAAAQRQPLIPNVAMTGSLSPDGTIGPVGGVARKLQAAQQAGYTKVVIPRMTRSFAVDSGGSISARDYAKTLGIDVVEVNTISESYSALTGKPLLVANSASSIERDLPEGVISARVDLIRKLFDAEVADSLDFPADIVTLIEYSKKEAEAARLSGRVDKEYAALFFPIASMRIHRAQSWVSKLYSQFGPEKTSNEINTEAEIIFERVTSRLESVKQNIDKTTSTVSFQQLSLLNSLNWAATESKNISVSESDPFEKMIMAAEQLAEARFEADVSEILMLNSFEQEIGSGQDCLLTKQGDSYANILWQAGSAAIDYLAAVQKIDVANDSGIGNSMLARGIDRLLRDGAPKNTPDCNVSASAVQLSSAINLFAMATGLVAAGQSFELELPENAGLFSIGASPDSMSESVRQSVLAATSVAKDLRTFGLSSHEANWSLSWSAAGNEIYNKTSIGSHTSWVALNESWGQLVALLVARSALSPQN